MRIIIFNDWHYDDGTDTSFVQKYMIESNF
jgi:hypothetical protein